MLELALVDDLGVAVQLSSNSTGVKSDEMTLKSSTRGIEKLTCITKTSHRKNVVTVLLAFPLL